MLKILLPLLLTPFLMTPKYWRALPMILFFLSFLSTALYAPSTSLFPLAPPFFSDHLSAPLITLTLWVCALTIPISLLPIHQSHAPLSLPSLNMLLVLTLVAAFSLNNLLAFYITFETSLIPTLFLILLWGYQPDRLQAGLYMMMYTVTASLPLLFALLLLFSQAAHLNMLFLTPTSPSTINPHLWWSLCLAAFLVKIPLYSLHLWLPKAHVEAPTAGSMILASILLKLGGYGLLRMAMMFQYLMVPMIPPLLSISMLGATLTGMICLRQTDLKALIAYSSVAHMGLVVAGVTSMTPWGWSGALTMMLAHGLSSPALFSLAGILHESTNTRSLFLSKGFLALLPATCLWWFVAATANMAAPPTLNLLGELLLLTSIMSKSLLLIPLIGASTFLAAAYSLHLYTATQHGTPPKFLNPTSSPFSSHNTSLVLHLSPLFFLILKPEITTAWLF